MTAEATVAATIQAARAAAQQAQTKAETYTDEAITAAGGALLLNGAYLPTKPDQYNLYKPLNKPLQDLGQLFENFLDGDRAKLEGVVTSELKTFLDTYYPDYVGQMQNLIGWLDNAITNGGTGLPAAIEQQLWDRARGREDAQALRGEEEVNTTFAARGWTLPQGAQVARIDEARQQVLNKNASLSRDVAIEQAKLEQSNVHFAVQGEISLKSNVMSSAIQYVGEKLRAAGQATEDAGALVAAEKRLYDTSLEFFRAQEANAELLMKYEELRSNIQLTENENAINAFNAQVHNRVNGAVAAAKAMGEIAAAALGSQNSNATIAHDTQSTQ